MISLEMDLRLSPNMSCQGKLAKSQRAQDDGVEQERPGPLMTQQILGPTTCRLFGE